MLLFVAVLGMLALTANCNQAGDVVEGQAFDQDGVLQIWAPDLCPAWIRICFNEHKDRFGYNGDNKTRGAGLEWQANEEEICKYWCALDDDCNGVTFVYASRFGGGAYCKHHINSRFEVRWQWADDSVVWRKAPCQWDCFWRSPKTKRKGWKWRTDRHNHLSVMNDAYQCARRCLRNSFCTGFHYKNIGNDAWKGCYFYWWEVNMGKFEYDRKEKVDFYLKLQSCPNGEPQIIYPVEPEELQEEEEDPCDYVLQDSGISLSREELPEYESLGECYETWWDNLPENLS